MSAPRFWVGQRVKVRFWEGEIVERSGVIAELPDDCRFLWVKFDEFVSATSVSRSAIIWEEKK